MRARGLKHKYGMKKMLGGVAPRAGAWIETTNDLAVVRYACRAPCGRVD